MAEKTWKIGESAKGGVITVKTTKTQFVIIGREWDFKAGSGRGSSQAAALPFDKKTFKLDDPQAKQKAFMYLTDLTTSYYADNILKWISSKVEFGRGRGSMFTETW